MFKMGSLMKKIRGGIVFLMLCVISLAAVACDENSDGLTNDRSTNDEAPLVGCGSQVLLRMTVETTENGWCRMGTRIERNP